jgi:hypothetical protein
MQSGAISDLPEEIAAIEIATAEQGRWVRELENIRRGAGPFIFFHPWLSHRTGINAR